MRYMLARKVIDQRTLQLNIVITLVGLVGLFHLGERNAIFKAMLKYSSRGIIISRFWATLSRSSLSSGGGGEVP